jgi:hypothetical protein
LPEEFDRRAYIGARHPAGPFPFRQIEESLPETKLCTAPTSTSFLSKKPRCIYAAITYLLNSYSNRNIVVVAIHFS